MISYYKAIQMYNKHNKHTPGGIIVIYIQLFIRPFNILRINKLDWTIF